MRFEWNAQSGNKAKILRECAFNLSFDAYDLCTPELQEKLRVVSAPAERPVLFASAPVSLALVTHFSVVQKLCSWDGRCREQVREAIKDAEDKVKRDKANAANIAKGKEALAKEASVTPQARQASPKIYDIDLQQYGHAPMRSFDATAFAEYVSGTSATDRFAEAFVRTSTLDLKDKSFSTSRLALVAFRPGLNKSNSGRTIGD